ncbi:hypothetical protein vseg_007562 [Gypsophila vaccaria]
MASGISEAESSSSRGKNKWSENIKVYTRRIHTNPRKDNLSNGNNDGETSGKTAVESSGGDKNCVVNGKVTENNVVEEVPDYENGVKEVINVSGSDVEKYCENVVEEMPGNANGVKEVINVTGNDVKKNCEIVVEEVPGNENGVQEVINVTGNDVKKNCAIVVEEVPGVKEVINVTGNDVKKNCEIVVEEVSGNGNGAKEVINETGNDVKKNGEIVFEEVPGNENGVKEVINVTGNDVKKNCEIVVEEVPDNANGVKEVINVTGNDVKKNCEIVVEEVPGNENGLKEVITLKGNDVKKNSENLIEEMPGNEGIIEDMAETTDNGCIIEETPTTTHVVEESSEKIIEEVPSNVNSFEEVDDTVNSDKETCDVNGVEEVPDKGNTIKEVTDNGFHKDVSEAINNTDTEEVPNIENNIEARNCMIGIEGALINENDVELEPHIESNVEEGSHYENNLDQVSDEDIEIREENPRKSLSPKLPVQKVKLLQPNHYPSNVEILTMSEDSSSHGRVEASLPNGHDRNGNWNGPIQEERSMVSQVDDRMNISVSAAKSMYEVRDLKRKLEDELDLVRKMARKLQAKETQLSNVDFENGRIREEAPVGRLRFPANGGLENDISNMTGNERSSYVSYSAPRPFLHLSSSVTTSNYHGIGENVYEKEKRTPRANQLYQNSDFVLGKEKLPPAKSNKKAKSSGAGRKHGGGDLSSGFGFDKKFHKKCSDLLQKLRKHKHGWVFNVPVDVKRLGLRDYFDIIKHPMDLGTVKTRLTNNWYKTPREFAEDVRLTFHNAMTYNPEGQDVHIMAKEMLRIFEEKWPSMEVDYDRKLRYDMFRDVGTPTPTSRKYYAPAHPPTHMPLPPPPLLHLPSSFQEVRNLDRSQSMPVRPESRPKATPSVVRTPAPKKPKAKDPDKRDMTFDEKEKLSSSLQCLPSDKLDAIVQIIKKRDSAFSQHDDEIEVDIDKVDTETLWELDRFVTNYKKRLSKYKRKAEIAMQASTELAMQPRATGTEAVQETVPTAPANVKVPKEGRADERNAVTSPHIQQERHSENASDSSSTSSSSSDSCSSSSDSDSDSSSDSE